MRAKIGTLTTATANMIWAAAAEERDDPDREQHLRNGRDYVDEAHQNRIQLASHAAGQGPDGPADGDAHHDRRDARQEADLGSIQDTAVLIATLRIGAHDVGRGRRLEALRKATLERPVRGQDGREHGGDHEQGYEAQPHQRRLVAQQATRRVAPQPARRAAIDTLTDRDRGAAI